MKIGTKSVLFGYHSFWLHPFFVACAWTKLYGFPFDPRLWIAFFVHDLGYVGKPNMDGPEGETHVELGAKIMHWLFDGLVTVEGWHSSITEERQSRRWHDFTMYHSRFYSKNAGKPFSKLCVADKLAFAMTPRWLCTFLVQLSGEFNEYLVATKYGDNRSGMSPNDWYDKLSTWANKWALENRDVK